MKIIEKLTPLHWLMAMAAFSAALLGGAFVGQYGFDLYPCELCLYQRYPYAAIIVLAIAALWMPVRMQRAAAWVCVLFLAVDAGIAIYHTGVEFQWFPGPTACSSASGGERTLEEIRAALLNAPLVSCGQAQAYIFGLSMAAWNALLASAMALLSVLVLTKGRKPL